MINKNLKHLHFIGIKGVAMTALAILAKEAGIKVTGSDTKEIFVTDSILKQKKIKWQVGFKAGNIVGKPDLVIVTGAHEGMSNIEAKEAKKLGLDVLSHGEALGLFMDGYFGISACGVGGKTTTAAMVATILDNAGLDPCYAIGVASINPLGAGGHYGKGKYFVVEADEYVTCPKNDLTPRFMWLAPKVIVITNIEYDHPDVYKDIRETKETFLNFANKVPEDGFLVVNGDNKNILEILPKIKGKVFTYGYGEKNDYRIKSRQGGKWEVWDKEAIGEFRISVPGVFNILNATAAMVTCLKLGISVDKIKTGLLTFLGTKRRFEFIREISKIRLYDDYAHHPIEIKATLRAARSIFPQKRIICIFQPHTFSRTKALFFEFAKSFTDGDIIIIADIYASAREKPDKSVNSEKLAKETAKYNKKVKYIAKMLEVAKYLGEISREDDVIFTMGAGDIFNYHKMIIKNIKNKQSLISHKLEIKK